MALEFHYTLKLYKMDVKTVFHNENVNETNVYGETRKLCIKLSKEIGMQSDQIHLLAKRSCLISNTTKSI